MSTFLWESSLENLKIDINTLCLKIELTNKSVEALTSVITSQGDYAVENCEELDASIRAAITAQERSCSSVNEALKRIKTVKPPPILAPRVQLLAIKDISAPNSVTPMGGVTDQPILTKVDSKDTSKATSKVSSRSASAEKDPTLEGHGVQEVAIENIEDGNPALSWNTSTSEPPAFQPSDSRKVPHRLEDQPLTSGSRFQALQKEAEGQQQNFTDDLTGLLLLSTTNKRLATNSCPTNEETAEISTETSDLTSDNLAPYTTGVSDRSLRNSTPLRYEAAEFVPSTQPASVSNVHERRQSTTEVLEGARDAVEKICNSGNRGLAERRPLDDDWNILPSDANAAGEIGYSPAGDVNVTSTSSSRRNSFASKEVEGFSPKSVFEVRKPPLGRYVLAEVTHIDKKKHEAYIVLWEDKEILGTIGDEISTADCGTVASADTCFPGKTIVVAPYNGDLYRARFDGFRGDLAEVYFVDFGNTETVPLDDIRLLSTGRGTRNALKTCQLAIRCEFEKHLDNENICNALEKVIDEELVHVLFSEARQDDRATVGVIKDIVCNKEAAGLIPMAMGGPLKIEGALYVVGHAEDPHNICIIDKESLQNRDILESEIRDLPSLRCAEEMNIEKGHYVTYHRERAIITKVKRPYLDLYMIDHGRPVKNVHVTECRRPPLIAYREPALATRIALVSCDFDRNSWSNDKRKRLQEFLSNCDFRLRLQNESRPNEVFLINVKNGKNIVKDLASKMRLCSLKGSD